jgi:GT2 family glycosyltransferase
MEGSMDQMRGDPASGAKDQSVIASHESAISIIIPTYNRCESLRATLRGLIGQSCAPERFEVLVISDGSTDGTAELCRTLDARFSLRYYEQEHEGPAAARNLGVRAARAPLVLFIDDDVVPDAQLVAEHVRLLSEHPDAVIIGPLLIPPGTRFQPWVLWEGERLAAQYEAMRQGRWKPSPSQFYTGNASVSRAAVLEAGGFDQTYLRAEDVELAFRLRDRGMRFVFAPQARGWHYARRSYHAWERAAWLYGEGDARMFQQQGRLDILGRVRDGYWVRRKPIQRLSRLCVGRPVMLAPIVRVCGGLAVGASTLPRAIGYPVSSAALSIIFNLCYLESLARAIGYTRLWDYIDGRCSAVELLAPVEPAVVSSV